jgi:hypothetical protein
MGDHGRREGLTIGRILQLGRHADLCSNQPQSFVRKADADHGNSDDGNFKGQCGSNQTHESETNPNARLYRRDQTDGELRFIGHTLGDNRHGLIARAMVTATDSHAKPEAAKAMTHDACQVVGGAYEIMLGADKGYDAREFIDALQEMNVVPHVTQNTSGQLSAVPDAIAGSNGYAIHSKSAS